MTPQIRFLAPDIARTIEGPIFVVLDYNDRRSVKDGHYPPVPSDPSSHWSVNLIPAFSLVQVQGELERGRNWLYHNIFVLDLS